MAETTIEPTLASLSERLRILHRQTRETPLFNPVFQLSLDISRKLEGGELSIEALAGAHRVSLSDDGLDGEKTNLKSLVEAVLQPYRNKHTDRIDISGKLIKRWGPRIHRVSWNTSVT